MSGKAMARTGLRMMPTFPSPPLKFGTAGFPRYGFKAGLSEGAFPARRPIVARPSGLPSSFALLAFQPVCPRSVSEPLGARLPPFEPPWSLYPGGPSPRSGLFCPSPSTLNLNRPHPPQLRAHLDFAALRFIRDAFAVHVSPCLGD